MVTRRAAAPGRNRPQLWEGRPGIYRVRLLDKWLNPHATIIQPEKPLLVKTILPVKPIPNLSDCRGLLAFGDVAADEQVERSEIPPSGKKMSFRYSQLYGMAYDAIDAATLQRRIKIGNPEAVSNIKIKR